MSMENEVLWLDENRVVGLAELVEISGLTREELIELVQGGAIPVREVQGANYVFSAQRDQRGTHRLPAARRAGTRHRRAHRGTAAAGPRARTGRRNHAPACVVATQLTGVRYAADGGTEDEVRPRQPVPAERECRAEGARITTAEGSLNGCLTAHFIASCEAVHAPHIPPSLTSSRLKGRMKTHEYFENAGHGRHSRWIVGTRWLLLDERKPVHGYRLANRRI